MKLLSICVPTYNRTRCLGELARSFLVPALDRYGDRVEIVVCDNSDAAAAAGNRQALDPRIRYRKNPTNLGFAGNLLRCVEEASGRYVWVVSDNDPIVWGGFEELMEALPRAEQEGVACLMLPFLVTETVGQPAFRNRGSDWGCAGDTSVAQLLKTGQVPFILFSSAVLRVEKGVIDAVRKGYLGNDYLQVILFCEMVGGGTVRFTHGCTVDYQAEYRGSCSVRSMSSSMAALRGYLQGRFGIPPDVRGDYLGWLTILLHHRGGRYRIREADHDRWHFLAQLPRHLGGKSLLLGLSLVIPAPLFRVVYLLGRSYREVRREGALSVAALRERVVTNRNFIASLRRCD